MVDIGQQSCSGTNHDSQEYSGWSNVKQTDSQGQGIWKPTEPRKHVAERSRDRANRYLIVRGDGYPGCRSTGSVLCAHHDVVQDKVCDKVREIIQIVSGDPPQRSKSSDV